MPQDAEHDARPTPQPTVTPGGRHRIALESRLVRYDEGADRRTVYPPGLSDDARMTTWLSADSDAFIDLEYCR